MIEGLKHEVFVQCITQDGLIPVIPERQSHEHPKMWIEPASLTVVLNNGHQRSYANCITGDSKQTVIQMSLAKVASRNRIASFKIVDAQHSDSDIATCITSDFVNTAIQIDLESLSRLRNVSSLTDQRIDC